MKSKFIDYARGFSILTIVAYHFLYEFKLPKFLAYAVSFGGAGVHLFIFSSGFGLAGSKYTTYTDFLFRRLKKVLIPYYIVITLIFFINIFVNIYPAGFLEYLSHIFLYKMFVPKYAGSFGVQFWFVSTIIQFYLVFPILLWAVNSKKYKAVFIICFLISISYSTVVSFSPYSKLPIADRFFIQYLWEFILGMIVNRAKLLDKLISQKLIYYVILFIINITITGLLAIKGGRIGQNFNDAFSFIAYTSIVIILYRLGEHLKDPFSKFIFWITGFSYTLYLIHMFIWDCIKVTNIYYAPFVLLLTLTCAFVFDTFVIKKITNVLDTNKTYTDLKAIP